MGNGECKESDCRRLIEFQFPIPSHPENPKVEEVLFWESPVGILYLNLDGGILRANPAMTHLIGYTETQLRRLDCRAISYPDDFADEVKFVRQLINGELPGKTTLQKRFICRNGTIIWAEVTICLMGEAEAEDSYLLVFAKDLSCTLRASEEIQQRREKEVLLSEIAAAIRSNFDFPKILEIGVRRLQAALNSDRVMTYQLLPDFRGVCASEAVNPPYPAIKGQIFPADCIPDSYLQAYYQGRLWHSTDIRAEGLSDCYRQMLERIQVRSIIVAPIQKKDDNLELGQGKLWGLLIVHQCHAPRQWTENERELVQAVAQQIAIAFEQASLVQKLQAYAQELEELVKERTVSLKRSLQFEQLIRKLTSLLHQEFNEDKILQASVAGLVKALDIEACYALLWSASEEILEVRQEYLKDEAMPKLISFKPPVMGKRLPLRELAENCRNALLSGKTYIGSLVSRNNYQLWNIFNTVLISPIWDTQGLIGAIAILGLQPRQFHQDEIRLVEQVATQCTIAIRQSRQLQLLQAKNQELATLNRMKGELIANTTHELRTPLTAVLGFSSVLLEECFGQLNHKQKEYVERIYGSGQYLLELINDILDMSRIEAGRLDLDKQVVFIHDLIENAIGLIQERAIALGLNLQVEIANDLEYLEADPIRLKQILLNLLSNAVKFTPKGTVGLKVYRSREIIDGCTRENVNFTVWDTGIGIDRSDQERLFSPFSQIHTSLSRKYPGTGLGLAIARRLAELHGGSITLESRSGEGSSFTLQLPLCLSSQT